MSAKHECPSLQTLPVELLHRIYDCLDIQTILLSLRNTSHRLRAVVNSYQRCVLDGKQFSKFDFRRLSRLRDLGNIVSLTLSGDDERFNQIELFLSSFSTKQFSQVQTLALCAIAENKLKGILKCVNIQPITSFSLSIKPNINRRQYEITTLISSIFVRAHLRKLELNIPSCRMKEIVWCNGNTIEYLRIGTPVDFVQICNIVSDLSRLQTLVLHSFPIIYRNTNLPTNPFPSVISLAIENLNTDINDIERLLSLTPSLIHLKLIGNGSLLDGNRWQKFIQNKLPSLTTFEFSFNETLAGNDDDIPDLKKIILPFQTTFWIEDKKWFVICECNIVIPQIIRLYSVPNCLTSFNYQLDTIKISLSTLPDISENNVLVNDNIDILTIDFGECVFTEHMCEKNPANHQLFSKVKELELKFKSERPSNWVSFISTIIDLSTIRRMKLTGQVICETNSDMLADITNLLKKTCNISSLEVCANSHTEKSSLTAINICSMTPDHVRHLAVSLQNISEAITVLHRLHYLSSAHFFFDDLSNWVQLRIWLNKERKGSTYHIHHSSIRVWLPQNPPQYRENDAGTKRIKLMDNQNNV